MIGVVSYGFYIPHYRIKVADIAQMWGKSSKDINTSLGIYEKTVSGIDEDSLTMAYEASVMTLNTVSIDKSQIGAVFFGSESPPYAVNPASTILAEFLGIEKNYLASDMQFACKAATGAVISTVGLLHSGQVQNALVVASDKATAKPHDALEYTAASGSVSLLLGKKDIALEIVDTYSFSSDTPDFWRREGIRYPSHGGRFTGKPSYFYHIHSASVELMRKNHLKPEQFAYAVFHMPNGKFPRQISTSLGFTRKQVEPSLVVSELGNSYTASALMGLVATLEIVKPGQLIFFASYGSGAGSDAIIFRVTDNHVLVRKKLKAFMKKKEYIDYQHYLRYMNII